jgi:hypothetical protein
MRSPKRYDLWSGYVHAWRHMAIDQYNKHKKKKWRDKDWGRKGARRWRGGRKTYPAVA